MILVGDLSITTLHGSIIFRGEMHSTWGDHVDLPLGFRESFLELGASLAWRDDEWDDRRRRSCERDANYVGNR